VDLNRIPSILLQTFLTVAEAGQISEAPRRLHLSQPAVTGHIPRLEANLEMTLFIRSANGVSLTERGANLRERVQDVFAELEQILQELDGSVCVSFVGILTVLLSKTKEGRACARPSLFMSYLQRLQIGSQAWSQECFY
jgi:regulatory helix-turn-helix LysR family protein